MNYAKLRDYLASPEATDMQGMDDAATALKLSAPVAVPMPVPIRQVIVWATQVGARRRLRALLAHEQLGEVCEAALEMFGSPHITELAVHDAAIDAMLTALTGTVFTAAEIGQLRLLGERQSTRGVEAVGWQPSAGDIATARVY